MHGLIAFSGEDAALARVLDTRAFQRLRRIRQDGFAALVYPGAEHSRFGHALGAFHVASRVTARLAVPPAVARDVKAAALVHDLGHGPFSHAWESALGGPRHEAWGARILEEDAEIRAALTEVAPGLPGAVNAIFSGRYTPRYAKRLVSSQLDVDRMDYLLRDAHFCGVGYSAYDLDWMIHALGIAPVHGGDDPDDLVVDYGRGLNALAQFLVGRSNMYAQVYYHKTVRAAEWMFTRVMERFAWLARRGDEPPGLPAAGKLARGEALAIDEYLRLDDVRVWCALEDWGDGATRDGALADLARRLTRRRLFKAIDIGDDTARAARLQPELAAAAERVLGADAASYFAVDAATREIVDPEDELYVVNHPRHGTLPLSRLVDELPLGRPVTTCRVLCAPELLAVFRPICAGG